MKIGLNRVFHDFSPISLSNSSSLPLEKHYSLIQRPESISKQSVIGKLPVDRDHQRALDALLEKLAAVLIDTADRAGRMVRIGRAAAAAVKTRPAPAALLARIDIAGRKIILDRGVLDAVENVAEQELLL